MIDVVNELNVTIPLICTLVITIVTTIISVVAKVRQARLFKEPKMIIGVMGVIPTPLTSLKDFSSLKKLLKSDCKMGVLHVHDLRFALKHCDFISVEGDVKHAKIHKCTDDAFWSHIVNCGSGHPTV